MKKNMMMNMDEVLAKAKKIRSMEKEDKAKVVKANENEPEERFIMIDSGELGFDSSKIGEDDLVKLQFTGRIRQKDGGRFKVSVDNIVIPREDKETKETKIIPSPSA